MAARRKSDPKPGDRAPRKPTPRKPTPQDAEVPPEQHPVKQVKDPRQPPREEFAEVERPHPGRHHPPRDGL